MGKNLDLDLYIESVISDFASWHEKIMLALLFGPVDDLSMPSFLTDDYFKTLITLLEKEKKPEYVDIIFTDFDDLKSVLSELSSAPLNEGSPEDEARKKKNVQALMDAYNRFLLHLKLCLKSKTSLTESDIETGLRPQSFLTEDYKKEMERFERNGQPCCFCLIRSDALWTKETDNVLSVLKPISEVVFSNLRFFDDAYRFETEYILVFLKHTGVSGCVKFYERLQRYLEGMDKVNGATLSVTACIAEPILGKNLPEILRDIKKDLDENCKDLRSDYVVTKEETDIEKFLGKGV